MSDTLEDLKSYVGRTATATDEVTASAVAKLAATFGIAPPASNPGDEIPVGWHGLYFVPLYGPDAMRIDGQAAGGGFMPSVPLARQRLTGDSYEFHESLRIGDPMTRTTEITGIDIAEDAHGPVVHLRFRHAIECPRGLAVTEDREFFYFDDGRPPPAATAPDIPDGEPAWRQVVDPNAALLFRYSAVRFNTHRVHYDSRFAMEDEGLPGLMVHGTLISQLMLEMSRNGLNGGITKFAYRTWKPVFDTGPFTLCGVPTAEGASLWCVDPDGNLAMTAQAALG